MKKVTDICPTETREEVYTTTKFNETMARIKGFLSSEHFVDVVLIAGRYRIKAHRLILSAASDYFAAMFTNKMRESTQFEITLKEINPWALQSIVLFIYTGTLRINDNVVRVLLETSRLLCMSEVEEFCVNFLSTKLSLSTCFRIRDFADSMLCAPLLAAARAYIAQHFNDLISKEEFLSLPAQELANLLSNHDLNITSEEVAFQALVLWLDYNLEERSVYAGKLLSHVRVPFLRPHFIVDNIQNEPLFFEDSLSRDIVAEAFEYQLVPELRSSFKTERSRGRPSVVGEMCAVGRIDGQNPTIKVEKYDTNEDKWHMVVTLTRDRLQFGVCEWDNTMCFVGGHSGPTILNTVECFNARTLAKTDLPCMKTARYGMGVGVLKNRIYVAGGHDGRSYINSVEFYDPEVGEFTPCAPMLTNKFRAGVAVLGDKLYAIGGINDSGRSATVECYDPFADRWTNVSTLSRPRNAVGVAVLDGSIYAVGGVDRSVLESMERYDPRCGQWTLVSSMKAGRARLGVCALGPWLYAAGGYNGGGEFLKHTEVYYPELNKWDTLSSLNEVCAANIVAVKYPRY